MSNPYLFEELRAQERLTQMAHARQERLLRIVPAQKVLDRPHELVQVVAHLGLAFDACRRDVFADLRRVQVQRPPDDAAGDRLQAFCGQDGQQVVVRRQAPQGGLGNGPNFLRAQHRASPGLGNRDKFLIRF
jgi:hypothetical protein